MADAAPHPFRIPAFRAYWLSRLTSTVATSAQGIIIGWEVYRVARDDLQFSVERAASLLGLIGLAQFVPLFLLTPVVGLVADTVDRRWIVRATTTLLVANAAVLGFLRMNDALTLPFLFGAAMLVGVARAFGGPAYSSLAPNLVPRESLPTAIAISAIAWQVGTIAGPSLGGVLYAIRPEAAYSVITILLVTALGVMLLIGPVPQPPAQTDRHPLRRILDGFGYVRRNRLVLATITLDLFVVLLAGATALLPIYARDVLHVGATGFGFLAAGMGTGAALGSLWFSVRPMKRDVGRKMLWSVLVFAGAIIVFGLSTSFPLSLAALVVAGASDMVSVYVRSSLIQLHTPDAMRGRVSAVSQLTISASNELGEAETGLMASLLGPAGAVVFGGVAAIAVTLAWSRLFPELRLAKSFDPPETFDAEIPHGVTQP